MAATSGGESQGSASQQSPVDRAPGATGTPRGVLGHWTGINIDVTKMPQPSAQRARPLSRRRLPDLKKIGNFELLSRLLITALLGNVIVFERERLTWVAGPRRTCWSASGPRS